MESLRSDVWNQAEVKIHAIAQYHAPEAITYSPSVRLHTKPAAWIKKRQAETCRFFGVGNGIRTHGLQGHNLAL